MHWRRTASTVDVNCAWCGEPWDVDHLRHEEGQAVYRQVLSGKGCPDCGFDHGPGDGPHREAQLHALVIDGVTDDDPMEFM